MKPPVQVVAVDDRPQNLIALEAILDSPNFELVLMNSGQKALEYMKKSAESVAVILLDVQMPGMDGFQTLKSLRQIPAASDTPVIFLTAIDASDAHVDLAYKVGAVDFLFKPFQPSILSSKVGYFVQFYNSRKQVEALQAERITAAAAETLCQSRDQLNIILDGVTDGIVVMGRNQRFIYANEAGAQLSGFANLEELLRFPIQEILNRVDIFSEDGKAFLEENLPSQRAFAGSDKLREEMMLLVDKKTGLKTWTLVSAKPVFDKNGEIEMVINFLRDFTEVKRSQDHQQFLARAALTLSSSLDYRTTISKVADLVVPKIADWCTVQMVSEDGNVDELAVAHVDPDKVSWAREFNIKYPPDLNQPIGLGNVIRTGKSELISLISDEMLVQGARDQEHLKILRTLGLVSYLAVPLLGRGRTIGAISFFRADSGRQFTKSDLKLAESIATRATLAIENSNLYRESQKINQVKDEFLATLSHELRTPLNIIQGHSELLLMEIDRLPDSEMVTSIQAIDRNAKLQTQIIADLLDVSSIITGKMSYEPVLIDPKRVLRNIAETSLKVASAKGVHFQIEEPNDSPIIAADPTRLHQILWNLVSNAIKFTTSGGRVSLKAYQEHPYFIFEVSDTGLGITPEFLPHVFDRFRQEDSSRTRKFGGLGLGLSIVRNLVELHGGKVFVESAGKNQGSQFRVQLPLAKIQMPTLDSERH